MFDRTSLSGRVFGGPAWVGDHRERPALRNRWELLHERLPAHIRRLRLLDGRTSRAIRPVGCELLFERDASGRLAELTLCMHGLHRIGSAQLVELLAPVGLRELSRVRVSVSDPNVCDERALRDALAAAGALVDQPQSPSPGQGSHSAGKQ